MVHFDLRYRLRRDGKFWFIECKDYPVFTQGRTKGEAVENLADAFFLYVQEESTQKRFPELRAVALPTKAVPELTDTSISLTIMISQQPRSTYETITNLASD